MDSDCIHKNLDNNICIECGYCFDNVEYLSDRFTPHTNISKNVTASNYKHVVKNQFRKYDSVIMKILVPLQLESYKSQLIQRLNITKFKMKLSNEDKVIVSLYHILKFDGFPIILSDLLKFTKLTKSRFLKICRANFSYIPNKSYFKAIYDRTLSIISSYGITTTLEFHEYLKYRELNTSTEPYPLCFALMICKTLNPVKFRDLKLQPISFREKIRKLCRRLNA